MPAVEVDGRRIAYDDRGSGPPVVLMHGLCMDRSMWDAVAEALSDGFRLITPDAPGHGDSDPVSLGYTFEDHARDILAFCDALGIDAAVFGGQSMGGFTALRLAVTQPDRVRGLLLADTSAHEENADLVPQYEAFLHVALTEGVSEDLAGVLFLVFFSAPFAPTPDGETWKKKLTAMQPERIHAMARAVLDRPSIADRLRGVHCPAVVVHGEEDIAISLERAGQLAAALSTEVVRVPGAGHASPAERPDVVTPVFRDFLKSLA